MGRYTISGIVNHVCICVLLEGRSVIPYNSPKRRNNWNQNCDPFSEILRIGITRGSSQYHPTPSTMGNVQDGRLIRSK